MSLSLGIHIRDILLNDTSITNLVSERIYPMLAPEGTDFPFITYSHPNVTANYSKDGCNWDDVSYTIQCVSKIYDEAVTISELVRAMLEEEGYEDYKIDVEPSDLVSSNGQMDGDLYGITLNFNTKTNYK